MSGWKAKRFWKSSCVVSAEQGYCVMLDARLLRTPAKAPLILPNRILAQSVADEWQAVAEVVDPRLMPITRAANAAIDKVAPQFNEVAELIAAYGASDNLCYRAAAPSELVHAQAMALDPLLEWAAVTLGAPLITTQGIVPVDQPGESIAKLSARVMDCTNFQLTALYDLVSLTGSLVLGLAATSGEHEPEKLWRLSRFDEDWQAEQWGVDEEASINAAKKREDFLRACHFWKISSLHVE